MHMRTLIVLAALLVSNAAHAAAGKVLFVAGTVTVDRATARPLAVNDPVEVGDVIVTGEKSRAQILMGDGARIALRSGTRFRIDAFAMPANVGQPGTVAAATGGRTGATLLQGGFRTRTGLIGRGDPSAYEVRTPVGTLGIRGTDYTAVFCRADCTDAPGLPPGQPVRPGLYLGVDEGRIVFSGRGLTLDLAAPKFAFIPLEEAKPEELRDAPAFLREDGAGALDVAGARGAGGKAAATDSPGFMDRRSPDDPADPAARDGLDVELPIRVETPGGEQDITGGQLPRPQRFNLSTSLPPVASQPASLAVGEASADASTFDATGALTSFPSVAGPTGTFAIGTAATANFGSDIPNGLSWGRWTGGAATFTSVTGTTSVPLTTASLHWISSAAFDAAPVLPITGTTSYGLIGGTAPTSGTGLAGQLDGAFVAADFTAGTVAQTLAFTIDGLRVYATGTGTIGTGTNLFAGNYGTVLVEGIVPTTGGFGGFLSPTAAGLTYLILDPRAQTNPWTGVVALGAGTGQPPPAPPPAQRLLAFGTNLAGETSQFDASSLAPASSTVFDATGGLQAFAGPWDRLGSAPTTATYDRGTARALEQTTGAGTGIVWGRWSGGIASAALASGTSEALDLTQRSLHYAVAPVFAYTPALPTLGTARYALEGATTPTNSDGLAGSVGAASFSADFTNRTVASEVAVLLDGRIWYGAGAGTFGAGSLQFAGTLAGDLDGLSPTSGSYSGFFSPASALGSRSSGAALVYALDEGSSWLPRISGAVVFFESAQGGTFGPLPRRARDLAYVGANVPNFPAQGPRTQRLAADEYAVTPSLTLSGFRGEIEDGQLPGSPFPGTFTPGTATEQDGGAAAIAMLRWGRWAGGTVLFAPDSGGTVTLDHSQRSLHFIFSGDSSSPPVIPVSGTYSYFQVGGTRPTDSLGNVATSFTTGLDADFTNQIVASTLDIQFPTYSVTATGNGFIGPGQFIQAPHEFRGDYARAEFVVGGQTQLGAGSFSGFFSGPTNLTGVPAGAALTFSLTNFDDGVVVDGVAALAGP
jgi:hypothetical protein